MLKRIEKLEGGKVKNVEPILCRVTGVPFYNAGRYTFEKLKGDPNNIAANLTSFIKSFSPRAREIIEPFCFEERLSRLRESPAFAKLASSKKRKDSRAAQAEIEAGTAQQERIMAALQTLASEGVFKDRKVFEILVSSAFRKAGLSVSLGLLKAIITPAAERDETAAICTDAKGNPEYDPELRAIAAFLDRETARIDELVEGVNESITLLREYRTSIVSAEVTGKTDIREDVES